MITNWHVVRDAPAQRHRRFSRRLSVDGPRAADGFELGPGRDLDSKAPCVASASRARGAADRRDLTIAGYGSGSYRSAAGACTQYLAPSTQHPYRAGGDWRPVPDKAIPAVRSSTAAANWRACCLAREAAGRRAPIAVAFTVFSRWPSSNCTNKALAPLRRRRRAATARRASNGALDRLRHTATFGRTSASRIVRIKPSSQPCQPHSIRCSTATRQQNEPAGNGPCARGGDCSTCTSRCRRAADPRRNRTERQPATTIDNRSNGPLYSARAMKRTASARSQGQAQKSGHLSTRTARSCSNSSLAKHCCRS